MFTIDMLFSSLFFIMVFAPVVVAVQYLVRGKVQNWWLLFASYIFYAWGDVRFVPVMLFASLVVYAYGAIHSNLINNPKLNTIVFWSTQALLFAPLIFYKYAVFLLTNIQRITDINVNLPAVVLPLGISFFTFQACSYAADVYMGKYAGEKYPLPVLLYIVLFPQLIAGPIVLFDQVKEEMAVVRKWDIEKISSGIRRFVIGLGKKVILANNLGLVADSLLSNPTNGAQVLIGVSLYSMQLYYDFAGYSDMAIGLGRTLGFNFPENFNYPYMSKSIQDFWRRWHMTLGVWFRDYIYFPLGGSKVKEVLVYRNIFVVFLLTGIWHGAAWNFVVWGVYNGVFLMLERATKLLPESLRSLGKYSFIQHAYALTVIFFGWLLFYSNSLAKARHWTGLLFKLQLSDIATVLNPILKPEFALILGAGIIGCTPLIKVIVQKLVGSTINKKTWLLREFAFTSGSVLVATLCIVYLLASNYNPFIYFRF